MLKSSQAVLWVSLGAVVGANLRYLVSQCLSKLAPLGIPLGTLVVNVTGSFVLGLFLTWTTDRVLADPRWRLAIAVGLCGGYTTFSSFAYETLVLLEQGQWEPFAWNLILTNLLCMASVMAGAAIARSL